MDRRFDDVLKEGIEKYLSEKGFTNPNSASQHQRGKALSDFYLNEIGTYLYKIYEDDIRNNICDGKGDLGIDFILKRDDSWLIFQSKYRGGSSRIDADEIAGFFQIHARISDPEYVDKNANSTLKEILEDFIPSDSVEYVFITNDKLSDYVYSEFKRLKEQNETINEHLSFELKGNAELKSDYKSVVSEGESITDEVIINIESLFDSFTENKRGAYFDLSDVIDKERRYKSVLCTIKGTTLKNLWQQHKSRLFNYNIRGFLGENGINKKMKETLANEPDKFYFYNNGISAICTDVVPILDGTELKSLKCTNFSIINGAQTTTTIGKYKNPIHLADVRVLLKITKAEDYKKEKGLNKKIITYNNSQTIIKVSDFRSNDDIQIFLETKLEGYTYRGTIPNKRIRYIRKRVKTDKKKDILDITIETLARALYVFDNDPILIFKGTKYLFDTESNSGGKYWTVFGENGQEVEFYDTKRTDKVIAIYFLWTKIEEKIKATGKQIKSESEETVRYQALLAKWHILWAYGYILKRYHADEIDLIFKKLSSGKIFDHGSDTFIDRWFNKVHNTIAKCIERNYRAVENKDGKDTRSFNFKNWLRSNVAFEELITEFKYSDKSEYPL